MHTRIRFLIAALCALSLPGSIMAQSAPDLQVLNDARKVRGDIVDSILKGVEKPETAVERLRALDSPADSKNNHDTDFALAAVDVGHRLLTGNKSEAAEQFFKEAEKSFTSALKRKTDIEKKDQAELLKQLALLRGVFLNNVSQARIDIEQALELQPDDQNLQEVRNNLARANAEIFKEQPKK